MNKKESKYFQTATKMDQAFLEILEKKDFAYITVKEICEKAGVNRSTFYLHYETLEDLLSESVEYMNQQFLDYMAKDTTIFMTKIHECPQNELYLLTPEYLIPYLNYVQENKRLIFTALKHTKVLQLEKVYDNMFRFVFVPILERYQVAGKFQSYMMAFYVQGLMAIVTQWLKHDCQDTPEQIIAVMQKCVGIHQKEEDQI